MRRFLSVILFLLCSVSVVATHQRSGEITFRHISGLTYEFKILTYTFAPSPADRPELEILWGDGTSSILPRTEKVDLANDIRRNVYVGQHTYSGYSAYVISLEDPNRNYGIINIPNSVNVPLYIQTTLVINPFLGPDNSPVLLNPPLDDGCTGIPYIHNPGAYDIDGDSISYRFIPCRGAEGEVIPGFVYPNVADPDNPPGELTINPLTGDILWDHPTMQGEFNLAMLIEEWRHGVRISAITRDMQIHIAACNNDPPVIQPLQDTCVTAGSTISFDVIATDINNDVITLTATGGPIVMENNPADFPQPVDSTGYVKSTFTWQTACLHVQKRPYQVFFKVTDDGQPVKLIDMKTVNILVNGPPPENLTATPIGNSVHLAWNKSPCSNASGYRVYRRFGSFTGELGYCVTGLPEFTGYIPIADRLSIDDTLFTDDNNGNGLIHGIQYCYRVVAVFPDEAESYASDEACASLKKDVPIITNVSIETTGTTDGSIYVAWSKPTELDVLQAPGPYKYLIYRSDGFTGANLILIDSLSDLNDTIYHDLPVNTADFASSYRIELYNDTPGNRFLIGSTQIASSVYLSITPTDNKLELAWEENVPWHNDVNIIYRKNPATQLFDSIGSSAVPFYNDSGLINKVNYCYYIKTVGAYSAPGIIDPIINFSQISCASPLDNVPPCPPELTVETDCEQVLNRLIWTNPNNICCTDVEKYFIYFSPTIQSDIILLDSTLSADDTTFLHANLLGIAGCYAITAIDTTGNQSDYSNLVCVSIHACPVYALPNVFTPNGDGYNDYLVPFPYTSVESIDLKIFNRWGTVVYETTNPKIDWDGKDKNTNRECSDGPYFYTCDVYEYTLKGLMKRALQGVVYILK
ncbi:MAG: gliding motility-associated C-terminal domain-containing protein [Bacteroidetes bacterium]|nr:gliding motility-associated C-terminal domain-containing protein [Bacteroidota bacterium]